MALPTLEKFKIETGLKIEDGTLVVQQHKNAFNTGQVSYTDNVVKIGDVFRISIHNEIILAEITGSSFVILQQPKNLQKFVDADSGQLCQLICECIDFNNIELTQHATSECKYIFDANEKQKKLCGSYAEMEKWGT